jgi:hypothetical protein
VKAFSNASKQYLANFRPVTGASHFALAAIFALSGILLTTASNVAAAATGVGAGAAYLLWRASSWMPAEEIIQEKSKHQINYTLQVVPYV